MSGKLGQAFSGVYPDTVDYYLRYLYSSSFRCVLKTFDTPTHSLCDYSAVLSHGLSQTFHQGAVRKSSRKYQKQLTRTLCSHTRPLIFGLECICESCFILLPDMWPKLSFSILGLYCWHHSFHQWQRIMFGDASNTRQMQKQKENK